MNTLPQIPWSTTGTFALGLIGFLSVIGLGLWIWNQGRKAFGRTPPFHEELNQRDKAIRRQIYAVEKTSVEQRDALRQEFRQLHTEQDRRLKQMEDLYADMQNERVRRWGELKDAVCELSSSVAFIRGQLEKRL